MNLDLEIFPSEKLEKEVEQLKKANKQLRLDAKGLDLLLRQNAALEEEVTRLIHELDEATKGVVKRGFLYKWRDREISYAGKWGLRYFVLQGKVLSYFADEHDNRPRRTIDLSHCIVRSDGTKKAGTYHVFCVYLASENLQTAESLLLRLSTESKSDALQWIAMLEQACAIADMDAEGTGTWTEAVSPANQRLTGATKKILPVTRESLSATDGAREGPPVVDEIPSVLAQSLGGMDDFENENDWGNTPIDTDAALKDDDDQPLSDGATPHTDADADMNGMSPKMKQRVRSTTLILRKSQSRSLMARQILHKRAPTVFSSSGANLVERAAAATDAAAREQHGSKAAPMRVKSFPAFKPMHRESKSSPLSYDRGPGEQNYRGFFNLGVMILFLSHFRMAGENFTKYGLLPSLLGGANPATATAPARTSRLLGHSVAKMTSRLAQTGAACAAEAAVTEKFAPPHVAQALLSWALSVLVAYLTERLAARGQLSESVVVAVNVTACTLNLLAPIVWVWCSASHPMGAMVYLFQSVILWMKLISYAHANRDLRNAHRAQKKATERLLANMASTNSFGSKGLLAVSTSADSDNNAKPTLTNIFAEAKDLEPPYLSYPMNITLPNLLYFCLAPTLTYQLNFPRLPAIRWKHLASICVRMAAVFAMILFFCEQYLKPTLMNSVDPMRDQDLVLILERLLKLSIPNTYVWLLGFYLFFHLWLNMLAEVTRFGDRLFYRDWWNARTIEAYWRNWNLPVHHWMLRHLYYPLTRAGVSKSISTFLVFALSAALHEIIISIPFHIISLHAFIGMLAQVPLIFATKWIDKTFDNAFMGNAIFWSAFCLVGQPMGIIMYYYDLWKMSQGRV